MGPRYSKKKILLQQVRVKEGEEAKCKKDASIDITRSAGPRPRGMTDARGYKLNYSKPPHVHSTFELLLKPATSYTDCVICFTSYIALFLFSKKNMYFSFIFLDN